MSDEYQLRKDIDKLYDNLYDVQKGDFDVLNQEDMNAKLENYYTKTEMDMEFQNLFNLIYPIGSIYMSVNSTDPSVLFGGRWQRIKDRFLLARGDTYPKLDENNNEILADGEAEHILTEDEMPSHTHEQEEHYHRMYGQYRSGSGSESAMANSGSNNSAVYRYTDSRVAVNKNTGGGLAHNNMPPYLVVNVWERVA